MTAIELAQKILNVQKLLESIEVKGYKNTSAVTMAYELCSEVLLALKETITELQNESIEEGDGDGKSN
jgi:hypothetical protein